MPQSPKPTSHSPEARRTLTVTQLSRQARMLLEDRFALVWVEGEISNLARPRSGHWYFTLKDDGAQLRCAMFAGRNRSVRFPVRDGLKVVLRGRVSLYEARGDFQLIADALEPAGEGALRAAFEALKAQLDAEGLFDPERKRPLPPAPSRLALITSQTGAVIRDFLKVLERRYPAAMVTVLPVPVQGDEAGPAIVRALDQVAQQQQRDPAWADLVVLARGGGSLEDLWAFNLEAVARAIAASPIPVVSAIGHQTDFTISDFVADLRAPTPSAAAEMITPDRRALGQQVQSLGQRLTARWRSVLTLAQSRLAQAHRALRSPGSELAQRIQRSDELTQRLHAALLQSQRRQRAHLAALARALRALSPAQRLAQRHTDLHQLQSRLLKAPQSRLQSDREQLSAVVRTLTAVSPLSTLERGFAVLRQSDGTVVDHIDAAAPGSRLNALVQDGTFALEVLDRTEETPFGDRPKS